MLEISAEGRLFISDKHNKNIVKDVEEYFYICSNSYDFRIKWFQLDLDSDEDTIYVYIVVYGEYISEFSIMLDKWLGHDDIDSNFTDIDIIYSCIS